MNLYIVRSNFENLIDSSYVTLTCMAYLPKILLIILRGNRIKEFIRKLHSTNFIPRKKEQFFIFQKYVQIAKTTSLVFITMCSITATIWAITPLMQASKVKFNNFLTYKFKKIKK